MKLLSSCLIALTACGFVDRPAEDRLSPAIATASTREREATGQAQRTATARGGMLPAKYVKAFMCEFDENPTAAADRLRNTPGGDLTLLRSLGFAREARDFGLDSVGGTIVAPPGTTVFGLPVKSLEINGMIGDYNALYVTRFADQVSVGQVVSAARLTLDRASFRKYKSRYYNRQIGKSPYTVLKLLDRGSGDAQLTCQVRSTPD